MSRTRRPSERDKALDDAIAILRALKRDHRSVFDALAQWSAGISAGGGGRRSIGGHSDPTGSRAVIGDDDARADRISLDHAITVILNAAKGADHVRRSVMAGVDQEIPKDPEARGVVHCANVNCPDEAYADKAGRCATCYQYWRRNDRDRRKSKVTADE